MELSIEDEIALLEANMAAVTIQDQDPSYVAEEELPEIYKIETIIQTYKTENKIIIKIMPKEASKAANAEKWFIWFAFLFIKQLKLIFINKKEPTLLKKIR